MYLSKAILLCAATVVAASNVTYSVVSLLPNNQTMGVIINNQPYTLNAINDASSILHTGKAPATNIYRYAILLKSNHSIIEIEKFNRTSSGNSTLNDYYGRSWNIWTIDEIPKILPPLPIIDRIKSKLHILGEIPTIHLTGNQTAIDAMHTDQQSEDISVDLNMTYISPNKVKLFSNVSASISGHSTRSYAKLSYNIKIPKGDDLFHYRRLKLRSIAKDDSYMREKLGYGIAKSVGLPSSGYSYVRLFINDQPIGLFGLAEVMKNPWIKNVFGGGSGKYERGALFIADISAGKSIKSVFGQNNTHAGDAPGMNSTSEKSEKGGGHRQLKPSTSDLSYLGNNVTLYTVGEYKLKEEPSTGSANYTRLMDLTKFISEQSNTIDANNSVVPLWQEKMDTDSFLRGLALEIVLANSDGYFTMTNNYMLYDDLEQERMVFSQQDFDLTMGNTLFNATLMNAGNYTEFPGFTLRPLMPRMLRVPAFKEDFEHLLVNITKSLVNLKTLETHINQTAAMITQDVTWDKTCTRMGSYLRRGSDEMATDSQIEFTTAINGPSNSTNNLALKEWLSMRSANLLHFFNQTL